MKFSTHLVFSLMLSIALFPAFGFFSLLALAGGIFADADHYLYYAYKFRKFNPFECNRFFTEDGKKQNYRQFEGILLVFHTLEFLLVMAILSFYNKLVLIFTMGLFGHYVLDFIWFKFFVGRFILNHSLVWWLTKFKKFK